MLDCYKILTNYKGGQTMKTNAWLKLLFLLLCSTFLIMAGCNQKAEESKPVKKVVAQPEKSMPKEEVKVQENAPVEEEKIDLLKIKETAMKEKEIILNETEEMSKLIKQKAQIPLTEQMGDEAKNLSQQIKDLKSSISEHTKRYNGYIEQLKAGNVDTSELKM